MSVCGEPRGYGAHRRRNEIPCDDCLKAHAAYERERRNRPVPAVRQLVECGTPSAWRRHLRRNEKPCEPCVLAHRADVAQYSKKRGAA